MKRTTILLTALSLTVLSACRTGTDAKLQQAVAETSMASSSTGMNTILDADSGAVARTINDGEIQMAQLALSNASSQAVRDYAQMMITDHTNANSMLQSAGYGMRENPITQTLNMEVNRQMSRLRGRTGAGFDREYIGSQVMMHQTTLDTMRTTLMPSAQEEKLKQTLGTMRETVQMHLEHARMMQSQLNNGTNGTGMNNTETDNNGNQGNQ
jgi:putative membrane protein